MRLSERDRRELAELRAFAEREENWTSEQNARPENRHCYVRVVQEHYVAFSIYQGKEVLLRGLLLTLRVPGETGIAPFPEVANVEAIARALGFEGSIRDWQVVAVAAHQAFRLYAPFTPSPKSRESGAGFGSEGEYL